jgi:mono/diheme cytochrome c family protein
VFEHKGTEYVAVYSAGALFAQSPPGDSVWLFALNGTLEELPSPVAPSAADLLFQKDDAAGETMAGTTGGAVLYQRHCRQCHGAAGEGGHGGGPALAGRPLAETRTLEVLTRGAEGMPGFGERLTYAEVEALMRFLTQEMASARAP